MQRRDYILMSGAMREALRQLVTLPHLEGIHRHYAVQIACAIKRENRAFDVARFLRDCGVADDLGSFGNE
jgi:hypothetical protein